MQTPKPRTPLERLVEERRMLRTLARLVLDDVREARADAVSEDRIALALGFGAELEAEAVDAHLEALRSWTT